MSRFHVSLILMFCCYGLPAQFSVGGYYPSNEHALRQLPVDKIDFSTYDIIYQAFLRFDDKGNPLPDEKLDPKALTDAASAAGNTRVIISCGGGRFKLFPGLCATPEGVEQIASHIIAFASTHHYNGIDLDWEGEMNAESGRRCCALITSLHHRIKAGKLPLTLSVTVMAGEWFLRHLDPRALALADWINLMAYDMNYQIAAYHAPLQTPVDGNDRISTENSLKYLETQLGVPRGKICVGLPFYGFSYENIPPGARIKDSGGKRDMISWRRIQELGGDFSKVYDPLSRGVKLSSKDGNTYILCDDPVSIDEKVKWIKAQGYRGVFVWAINQDRMPDGQTPLSDALKKAAGTHVSK